MFYEYNHLGSPDYLKIEKNKNFSFPSHLHQCFEIIIILSGEMDVIIDGKKYTLKKGEASLVTQEVNLKKNLSAPITKNSVVGTIDFFLNEQQIGQVNIIADETVDKMSFLTAFLWILDGLLA